MIDVFQLGAISESSWFDSGCGAGPRARWLLGGRIEVEGEGVLTKALPEAVKQWGVEVSAAAAKYDLWPNLIQGVMATESGGKQGAKSFCCYGLMGLLPATASGLAGRSVSPDELLGDPMLNVDLGSKLISNLMTKYGGNVVKVATAYNAGGAYCSPAKGCLDVNRWGMRADCPQGHTIDYPTRVISYANAAAGSVQSTQQVAVVSKSRAGILIAGLALAIGAVALTRSG